MTEPIFDPAYWAKRLKDANQLFHAIYKCDKLRWLQVEAKHRSILAATIGPGESVLDAGCGYGRLLTLMPDDWHGSYLGVDLSPDFIALAKHRFPERLFTVGDLRQLDLPNVFHWAVLISIRPMVARNCGIEVWQKIEQRLKLAADKLLFLEYDENAEGEVVLCR